MFPFHTVMTSYVTRERVRCYILNNLLSLRKKLALFNINLVRYLVIVYSFISCVCCKGMHKPHLSMTILCCNYAEYFEHLPKTCQSCCYSFHTDKQQLLPVYTSLSGYCNNLYSIIYALFIDYSHINMFSSYILIKFVEPTCMFASHFISKKKLLQKANMLIAVLVLVESYWNKKHTSCYEVLELDNTAPF